MTREIMTTFSVTVPTYKREKDLGECLESILSQSLLPGELLLIDDDLLPAVFVDGWRARFAERRVAFKYYRKNHAVERRGQAESKNIALREAAGEIIFFLDDDLVLRAGFLQEIMKVWNDAPDPKLLAVGGVVENDRRTSFLEKSFNRLFGLASDHPWDINEVGYQVWDNAISENTKGYYTLGGLSSYRRAELAKLGFPTFVSGGRSELEEIDLCLNAKRAGYHMMLVPQAKALHKESAVSRESAYMIGAKQSFNRKEIYGRYGLKTLKGRLWFFWASVGWVLRQILVFHWEGAAGRVYGFLTRPPAGG